MNIWKLYLNSKIIPEKNFKVDSLETYLSTLTKVEITGETANLAPQYIKHDLSLIVKINKNQSTLNFFASANNYNYMSIKNDDDSYPVYYFIIKKSWISENTIALTLKMDTVNTFTAARGNFTISDRTLVNREHKDRLQKLISYLPFRKPLAFVPIVGTEYRFSSESTYLVYYESSTDDGITIKKYNASGALIESYVGHYLSLSFNGIQNVYTLYDIDNNSVWSLSSFSMNTQYNNGVYFTFTATTFTKAIEA